MMKRKGYIPPEPPKTVKKRVKKVEDKEKENVLDNDIKDPDQKKPKYKKANERDNGVVRRPPDNMSW